jgi:hypothetical protein
MVDNGEDFSKVHKAWTQITEEEWATLKETCALASTKDMREWGLQMHGKNIGTHTLGSQG